MYVTYALQNDEKHDDVSGAGHGAISVFDPNGKLVRASSRSPRRAAELALGARGRAARWGMLGGTLLVGNLGDGAIDAFDLESGAFVGS